MRYCPNCKKPYEEENFLCPDCGYSPDFERQKKKKEQNEIVSHSVRNEVDGTSALAPEQSQEPVSQLTSGQEEAEINELLARYNPEKQELEETSKVNRFKDLINNPYWLSIIAGVLIASLVVGYFVFQPSKPKPKSKTIKPKDDVLIYEGYIQNHWNAVKTMSDKLVDKAKRVDDQASLDKFSAFLTVAVDQIEKEKEAIENAKKVPSIYLSKQKELISSIQSYKDYLNEILRITDKDPKAIGQENFEPVDVAGQEAKKKTGDATENSEFLKPLSKDSFTLQSNLISFYEGIWQQNYEDSLNQSQSTEQTTQQSAPNSERLAKETIISFSESYKAGDYDSMDSLLYGEAADQFERRQGIKPYDYEIESQKYQDGNNIFTVYYYFKTSQYGPYFEEWTIIDGQVENEYLITGCNLELRTGFTPN